MGHRLRELHTLFQGFTSTFVSSSPFARHFLICSPLHDHVHVLMWIHSTKFGNLLLGLHWSSSFDLIDQVFKFYCKGCQRVYLRNSFGLCCQGYLQEFWTLDLVKHGIIGEVMDDGSHRKEGGEIGYRQ